MNGSSTLYKKSTRQVSCKINDEVAILDLERAIYFGLQGVGVHIWDSLEQPRSVDDLCASVMVGDLWEYGLHWVVDWWKRVSGLPLVELVSVQLAEAVVQLVVVPDHCATIACVPTGRERGWHSGPELGSGPL